MLTKYLNRKGILKLRIVTALTYQWEKVNL